jgi:predicted nucleic acid-binding protein
MEMIFFDTNIIIYLSKKLLNTDDIIKHNEKYAISIVSYMEILGYNFQNKQEEIFIEKMLSYFKIVYIDIDIANEVIKLRKKYKIKLPDAIIVATSSLNNARLITNDIQLSKIKELNMELIHI